MRRLLRVELEKFGRNWLLIGIMAVMAVFLVVVVGKGAPLIREGEPYGLDYLNRLSGKQFQSVANFTAWHENYVVRAVLGDGMLPLWSGAVLAAFFVGQEFEGRTVNAVIMRGHSRTRIFLSKVACYYVIGTGLSLAALFATLFVYVPGWYGRAGGLVRFLQYLLLRVVSDMGTLSIPLFLAFLCRDLIKTVSFSAAYALVLTLLTRGGLSGENAVNRVLSKHPVFLLRMFMRDGAVSIESVQTLVLVSVGMVLATGAAAYMLFRRAELK